MGANIFFNYGNVTVMYKMHLMYKNKYVLISFYPIYIVQTSTSSSFFFFRRFSSRAIRREKQRTLIKTHFVCAERTH